MSNAEFQLWSAAAFYECAPMRGTDIGPDLPGRRRTTSAKNTRRRQRSPIVLRVRNAERGADAPFANNRKHRMRTRLCRCPFEPSSSGLTGKVGRSVCVRARLSGFQN
eukprot:3549424-Rhodomonas_salina.1